MASPGTVRAGAAGVLAPFALYDKEGSWEAVRAPVDLQLANSNWTADRIEAETDCAAIVARGRN